MANSSLSLVNQKLAYARALIKQASPLSDTTTTSERLQLRALLDASVFHLMCGIHHYLREIAENYRVKNVGTIEDTAGLLAALAAIDKEPSEATELSFLLQDSSSWLSQMQNYYARLGSFVEVEVKTQVKGVDENLIAVREIPAADVAQEPDWNMVNEWEGAFTQLIARQRETSAEY